MLEINEMPSHTHIMSNAGDHNHQSGGGISSSMSGSSYSNIITRERTGIWTDNAGNHSHVNSDTGGNKPHNNMPPWWALAYIIKL